MNRLIATAALMLLPTVAGAQAWVRDAGSGYVNVTLSRTRGNELYSPDFEKQPLPTTYDQTVLGLYGEVGVIDRWLMLTIDAELYRQNTLEEQGATSGIGDARVGLWTPLVRGPLNLTAGVQVGLPLGDNQPTAGAGADGDAELIARSLPTGDGEFDLEPRVALGYSLSAESWPLRHYFAASLGYAIRTSSEVLGQRESFADAITYSLEVGTQVPAPVLDRFWLAVRVAGVESFADSTEAARGAVGIGNGVTYTTVGATLSGNIYDGFGALVSFDTALRARSIISAPALRFGLSYAF